MFRWVGYQLYFLRKCLNRAMVRLALNNLPVTFIRNLRESTDGLEPDYWEYVLRILYWLHSFEPH